MVWTPGQDMERLRRSILGGDEAADIVLMPKVALLLTLTPSAGGRLPSSSPSMRASREGTSSILANGSGTPAESHIPSGPSEFSLIIDLVASNRALSLSVPDLVFGVEYARCGCNCSCGCVCTLLGYACELMYACGSGGECTTPCPPEFLLLRFTLKVPLITSSRSSRSSRYCCK
ncbi:hypothetical protein SARC_07801 [Sphaeroforma arctica JP610]|uniref:Uncharacterized protein n=1 Tax=Sphaeroforma arctica JP610 TaxID=667725 RepID=A0A0L0FSR1_9EUKA|nr:hypothetical protein SARC_07801 [Sphaeroforma arctica JP610]KNC79820.1 hypothetical protein SARC_07801 [Sphaeroforma arctica JP610]|eukprot:XP_014153722.1 hypothetical protein SARC_07801 [Sphaeroforma arctica JP610]